MSLWISKNNTPQQGSVEMPSVFSSVHAVLEHCYYDVGTDVIWTLPVGFYNFF